MDPETLKLFQSAITQGVTLASWQLLLAGLFISGLSAGFAAFFGSYLKKKGEDVALQENFAELLKRLAKQTTLTEEIKYEFGNIALKERFPIILAQLEAQTKVTEALKHEFDDIALRERFATVLAQLEAQTKLTESIKYDFAIELENIKYGQGENIFIRDLYAGNIKEYSAEQAYALRQAYLILYEPSSSTSESEGKGTEERLDAAIQLAMTPLRKHIGWLDEQTIGKIYEVQHEFLEIKHNNADQFRANKQDVFDLTEEARQFVKADKIALRLRLIRHSLDSNERTVTDGRT